MNTADATHTVRPSPARRAGGQLGRKLLNLSLFASGCLLIGAAIGLVYFSDMGATGFLHPVRFRRSPGDTPARFGVAYQAVTLRARDGVQLQAWYTPPQNGGLILLAHGYGSARSSQLFVLLARHGYGVVAWDARAHGESGGDLCTWGYREMQDVEAALDFALAQREVRRVGALGESMGAVTLIKAAVRHTGIQVQVADSAFPAIEDMLSRVVAFPPMRPVMRLIIEQRTGLTANDVRPVDDIAHLSPRPVLIIQGQADTLIPPDSAARLYAAAREPRALWLVPAAPHVGAFDTVPEEYARRVLAFLDAALLE